MLRGMSDKRKKRVRRYLYSKLLFICDGGDHDSAFQYFIKQGIVTGGAYHSHKGCMPYPIRPNSKESAPKTTQCVQTCESSYNTSYEKDKIKGKDQVVFMYNNKGVMDEIMKNGPLVAEFRLYDDLLSYKSGIYEHKKGKFLGHYYSKIVGWGKDDQPYWRAAASFGKNWGKK
jgi:cathepsin B